MLKVQKNMNETEARFCVQKCDRDFDRRLARLAREIGEGRHECGDTTSPVKLIALSGPSCSGKTTAAKKFSEDLSALGRRVHTVSIDDYYIDRNVLTARAGNSKIDLDSPDTIDIDALSVTVREIFDDNESTVEIPVFDFHSGKRSGTRGIPVDESDVFIFEGIQALYPNVALLLMKYPAASVFICASQSLNIDGNVFGPNEIRLMRRIVRDYYGRSASPGYSLMLWETVRENEERNIFPFATSAHYRINSTMKYDVGMLKPYLELILPQVGTGDPHYGEAMRLLDRLQGISDISSDYLAPDSLYHEFV